MAEEKKKHNCPFCPPEKPCGWDWCSWNGEDSEDDGKDESDSQSEVSDD